MSKFFISVVLVAIVALMMNRVIRISARYERSDKSARELSTWSALDYGIDPTESPEK